MSERVLGWYSSSIIRVCLLPGSLLAVYDDALVFVFAVGFFEVCTLVDMQLLCIDSIPMRTIDQAWLWYIIALPFFVAVVSYEVPIIYCV